MEPSAQAQSWWQGDCKLIKSSSSFSYLTSCDWILPSIPMPLWYWRSFKRDPPLHSLCFYNRQVIRISCKQSIPEIPFLWKYHKVHQTMGKFPMKSVGFLVFRVKKIFLFKRSFQHSLRKFMPVKGQIYYSISCFFVSRIPPLSWGLCLHWRSVKWLCCKCRKFLPHAQFTHLIHRARLKS